MYGTSKGMEIALNIGLVNRSYKKGKGAKKKYMLLFMPHPPDPRLGGREFYDQDAFAYENYPMLRKIAKHRNQKICLVITVEVPGSLSLHTQTMIDDLRGNVTVFDNAGTFKRNATQVQQREVYQRVKQMTRRRSGYAQITVLPPTCPRINETRPYCTYWSALFLKYVLEHPTKGIKDFVNHVLKQHPSKSAVHVKAYMDRMIPGLNRIACSEARRLVAADILLDDMPPECQESRLGLEMSALRL